jgi:potassium-dependent mechanosensitive channel
LQHPRDIVTKAFKLAFCALLFALATLVPAQAQDVDPAQIRAQVAEWTRLLDRFGREVSTLRLDEDDVHRLTDEANRVKGEATVLKDSAAAQVAETRELLDSMGEVAQGATESPEAAAQRKDLQERLAHAEGWQKQAELAIARADQLIDRAAAKRIALFARTVLKPGPSPLVPQTWIDAGRELASLASLISVSVQTWSDRLLNWSSDVGPAMLVVLAAAVLGAVAGLGIRSYLTRRHARHAAAGAIAPLDVQLGVAARFIAEIVPLILALVGAWAVWPPPEFFPNNAVMAIVYGIVIGIVTLVLCRCAIGTVLAPAHPQWRALPVSDAAAAVLSPQLKLLVTLLAIHIAVDRGTAPLSVVDSFTAVWNLLVTLIFAVTLRRVLDRRLWAWSSDTPALPVPGFEEAGAGSTAAARSDLTWRLLRYAAMAAMWAAPLVVAVGYANLGEYISVGLIETGIVLFAAAAGKLFARAFVEAAFDPGHRLGRMIGQAFTIGAQGLRLTQFWLGLAFDFLVAVLAGMALLVVWGASRDDILVLGNRLVEGVRIGPVTVSITDVLLAMLVFTVVIGVTRYVQRILDMRVFPGTQLDAGVRHSLRTSVGYVGLVIGAGLAIGTLGLNLSSLAIVAGALSVGIGFGLQNIVNNFVSGLILLVERPIKAGDWVEVGDSSGIVKRINVRSTELETFNRSTILIPNSQLVSAAVTNWTHKDVSGRVEIPVKVANVKDAASVKAILLDCAGHHPGVMKSPGPGVLLKDFSGNSFEFVLQVAVPRALEMQHVASDLRFAIDQAFRQKGIVPAG